jgi:hypothetical protein
MMKRAGIQRREGGSVTELVTTEKRREDQFARLLVFKESYLTIFVDLLFGISFELVSKSLLP